MEPQKPEMENELKPETENELKPKVRALYEAVLELLNENADISTMKVSDITSRAGIGKGTAYDYFKKQGKRSSPARSCMTQEGRG